MSSPEISFGPFQFNTASRLLTEGETPVQLSVRALSILSVLIETPGRLVSKAELLDRAWPGLKVDESNLRVQISGLRKALGDHGNFIRSEACLGYRFVGKLATSKPAVPARQLRVPRTATMPLGREEVIASIVGLLGNNRLVTIVGPGGIGKTTVALALANEVGGAYRDGACFVDFGRVADEKQVYAAVTGSLDFAIEVAPTVEQILLALHGQRLLLILDSCEHVTERVAQLAERILTETSDICILVTTRESLRVAGEAVWRLEPLETPPLSVQAAASNIQGYSSVQLFARTARQGAVNFQLNDGNAETVAEICRRLDGIPLAIELAASMVDVLGIDEIRCGLDKRFSVLNVDRRTAIPRQRSMAATIDWSYSLLPAREKTVLRRLACFTGSFTADAAIAVASGDELDAATVLNAVAALANKSLLNVNHQVVPLEYRLLETTKAYARCAPCPVRERERANERHARYFLNVLEQMNWDAYDPAAERTKMRGYLEEVRAALDWAFAADPRLGMMLTLAAERLWLEFASLAQGIHYLGLAARQIDDDPGIDPDLRARVLVAHAAAQAYIMAPGHDDTALYEQAWRSAQIAQDDFLQLRALYALIHNLLRRRRSPSYYLEEFSAVAARSGDTAVQHLPLVLSAYHDVEASDVVSSSRKLDSFITNCAHFPRKYSVFFGHNGVFMCQVTFALIRYWMGYCGQARSLLAALVDEAEYRANPTALCFALAHGAIWCELRSGDIDRAAVYLKKLEEIATLYKPWQGLVETYRAILMRHEGGDLRAAEKLLNHTLQNEIFLKKQAGLFPVFLFELAEIQLMLGDLHGTEATLSEAMTYRMNDQDARTIGRHDHLLAQLRMARNQPGDLDTARDLFKRAIEVTSFRSIYLFEFEATVGLAELELAAARSDEARLLIKSLLARLDDRGSLPLMARAQDILDRTSKRTRKLALSLP